MPPVVCVCQLGLGGGRREVAQNKEWGPERSV